MAHVSNAIIQRTIPIIVFVSLFGLSPVKAQSQDGRPVADAGSSRYAAMDPMLLDGTGSYDPNESGSLSYSWQQISGPTVAISDANTATPTVSGFIQTDNIQECEFELVVSDGQHESLPDAVELKIVPFFSGVEMLLENDLFDPNKPTIIYFGGGDGINGLPGYAQSPWDFSVWSPKANLLSFPDGYRVDLGTGGSPTYHSLGNAIISYLSAMAPNYHQPIQTIGWSTGGLPAIIVATYLNQTYQDARYAVNRITGLDAVGPGASEMISQLLDSSVDSEQCWLDSYVSTSETFYGDILNVSFSGNSHELPRDWYGNSLTVNTATLYNSGIVGGAYWSVIGPGKNLQLAPKSNAKQYIFNWHGSSASGNMYLYDESRYPGRLPEPVTLIGPTDGAAVDANGAILTCEESENAVGYQLLFGFDPHRVMDYMVISDTSEPPSKVITTFPFEQTLWTIKVRDRYGSTIYADPIRVVAENIAAPVLKIENVTLGKGYSSIQPAIDEAVHGDQIVAKPGIYRETVDFKGKNLTLRSTDPNDPTITATTVISGINWGSAVTFSSGEDTSCTLAGFTIVDANEGVSCSESSPTIVSCRIVANVGAGIELRMGSNPTISNCIIAENGGSGIAMYEFQSGRTIIVNAPTIANCTIIRNSEIGISEGVPSIIDSIIYDNAVQIVGFSGTVEYSDVQGGFPGEGNIDTDPLFADPENGDYHLKSQAGRWGPLSQSWVHDDVTSPCIDAGYPTSSVGLEPAPNGGKINIGAYGGTTEASKSP